MVGWHLCKSEPSSVSDQHLQPLSRWREQFPFSASAVLSVLSINVCAHSDGHRLFSPSSLPTVRAQGHISAQGWQCPLLLHPLLCSIYALLELKYKIQLMWIISPQFLICLVVYSIKNSIILHRFCIIVGIFCLWLITAKERNCMILKNYMQDMHATPKSFCSIQLMMKSSFFSLSTALTYYIHLSNSMGNHRHY